MQATDRSIERLLGQIVDGYEVVQLLGQGKVNAVFQARQPESEQRVLLTIFLLPAEFMPDERERFIQRFLHEAGRLAQLQHPHILPVYTYGLHTDYPYLISPLVTTGSLATVLSKEGVRTPEQTLTILQQVAAALDYAHSQQVMHETLKSANVLFDSEQRVLLAGFGLARMLSQEGIVQGEQPYAHLLSIGGTFLGSPEYIAPEVVEGAPVDVRSEIYSLGLLVYEMLSGRLPFTGDDPFAVAWQRLDVPIPPLSSVAPTSPPVLDLVLQYALKRDPARRYVTAEKLAQAFAYALNLLKTVQRPVPSPLGLPAKGSLLATAREQLVEDMQTTHMEPLPTDRSGLLSAPLPVVDANGNWQIKPSLFTTNPTASVDASSGVHKSLRAYMQAVSNGVADAGTASDDHLPGASRPMPEIKPRRASRDEVDPFVWWSTSASTQSHIEAPLLSPFSTTPLTGEQDPIREALQDPKRRKALIMIASGSVIAMGMLGLSGLSLTNLLRRNQLYPQQQMTPQPVVQPKNNEIGQKTLQINSAASFKNPADNKESLLIHLPNGAFVAYESSCTHENALVRYDPSTQLLICTRHQAVFDPARAGKVLLGPATTPLKPVVIKVAADGIITAG